MTTTPIGTVNETLLRQMAAEIREEIPEAEVRLFGSHARGDARPSSDVDLMIIVKDEWYAQHNWFETLGLLWRKLAHHRAQLICSCTRAARWRSVAIGSAM